MITKVNWKTVHGCVSVRAPEKTRNQRLFPSISYSLFFFQNIAIDPSGEHTFVELQNLISPTVF